MEKTDIPHFADKTKLHDWLYHNKSLLINQKKSTLKRCDSVSFYPNLLDEKGEAVKADSAPIPADATKLKVVAIINTTKLMDSHSDVHIDGLWKKSINETKDNYLVQEHDFSYKGIISDAVKVYTKQMTWKELGFDLPGETQALVYEATIDKKDNPTMFGKYAEGKVKNHSVGMRYVKFDLAMSDPRYKDEFANWEKYISEVANKDIAEEQGYFWPVTEAKNIEGSAVPRGSNYATPTQSVTEAGKATSAEIKDEPPVGTQKASYIYNPNLI